MDNSSKKRAVLDKIAVGLSGLCLLHCLLLPFAVAVLPFIGQLDNDHLHAEMLIFVIPVSVVALAVGFRRHGRISVILSGATGLAILIIGALIVHDLYGLLADRAMTVAGSFVLAFTHYQNFRLAKKDLLSIPQ
ncbi:MAG: MerC domain-containing protein [Proteobacteria bacterium]|nr:MerC domain-containing protein [Pseudomonadota bacterium]MDA0992468.1 MerC domain-containing protein [Pseudomonadota bacterium]